MALAVPAAAAEGSFSPPALFVALAAITVKETKAATRPDREVNMIIAIEVCSILFGKESRINVLVQYLDAITMVPLLGTNPPWNAAEDHEQEYREESRHATPG